MIDALISSDLAVLARENGRIPPLDAVMPTPVVATPRTPIVWWPWLVRGAGIGVAALVFESNWTFQRYPQALPIIGFSIAALVGLVSTPRTSFHRELGALFGSVSIAIASIVMLYLSWTRSAVIDVDRYAVAVHTPYGPDQLWLYVIGSAIAVGVGYLVARCVRPRPRSLQPWAGLATVMTAVIFMMTLAVQSLEPRWFDNIPFGLPIAPDAALHRMVWRLAGSATNHSIFDYVGTWQIVAFEAAGVATALVAVTALAFRSRLGARWLAVVSHVIVVPTCVAIAMWQVVDVSSHDYYGGQDDRAFAIATVAVVVALLSMIVRRRANLT